MLAFMNREALAKTAELGEARLLEPLARAPVAARARRAATCRRCSELRLDCDNDVVLLKVEQTGAGAGEPTIACHTGRHSCFFQRLRERRLAGASSRS